MAIRINIQENLIGVQPVMAFNFYELGFHKILVIIGQSVLAVGPEGGPPVPYFYNRQRIFEYGTSENAF